MPTRRLATAAVCGVGLLTIFSDRPRVSEHGAAVSVDVVSGDGQSGSVNSELPQPLVVRVVDDKGKGVSQLVNFRVTSGGGRMFAGAALTDETGQAQDYWTLGPVPGLQQVDVVAVDPTTGQKQNFGTFTATAIGLTFQAAHGVNGGTSSSPSLSGISISGQFRLLICVVAVGLYNSSTVVTNIVLDDGFDSGAQSLTQLGDYYSAPPDGLKWSTWYLTEATATAGRRVVATLSSVSDWSLACDSYSGVDISNPFGPVNTIAGTTGPAHLTVSSNADGSLPWAHLFSSNSGYIAGTGVTNRQRSAISGEYSYLVDGNSLVPSGFSHTFNWSYLGTFGGQGAMIRQLSP